MGATVLCFLCGQPEEGWDHTACRPGQSYDMLAGGLVSTPTPQVYTPGMMEKLEWKGRYIPGEGPSPCRIAFFGEAPGYEEDEQGRPFCGPSGAILDTHLLRMGLPRHTVWVDNLYRRRPSTNNDDPTPEQIAEGLQELYQTVREVRPEIIVLVGRISAEAVLGSMFKSMDMMHGIPIDLGPMTGFGPRWAVPMYHPAAGMHEPRMMERFIWDLEQVVRLFNTGQGPDWDQTPPASYKDGYGLGPSPKGKFLIRDASVDTEGVPGRPTHMSWSVTHNTGRVVLAEDARDRVGIVPEAKIRLFNSLWDLPIMEELGHDLISLDCEIEDPMIWAYVLQDEPQALKNLAYKYRGKIRLEYMELVEKFYEPALKEWFLKSCEQLAEWRTVHYDGWVSGWRAEAMALNPKRAPKLTKKVEKLFSDRMEMEEAATYGLYLRFLRIKKDMDKLVVTDKGKKIAPKQVNLKSRLSSLDLTPLSPPPTEDLSVVPEKDMVDYTCADSDDTQYITPILKERVRQEGLEYIAGLDHAILPMLHAFHKNGLPVDLERATQLSVELEVEALVAHEEMKNISGRDDFNPGSGDQVADILNDLLMRAGIFDRQKQTKSGSRMTTDEKALFNIGRDLKMRIADRGSMDMSGPERNLNQFLAAVKKHRSATKTKGTFIDPTIERVLEGRKGRLFFTIKNTRVYSGRLSGDVFMFPRDPRVRKMFRCKEGHKIVAVDLSQIEPRTMAHLSGDPELCRIYKEGRDLYAESASSIMHRPLSEVGKGTEIRQAFKTIDLSMLYLISSPTLHGNLLMDGIELYTLEDVAKIRETWLGTTFAGIMPYYEQVWREVLADGWVRDMWGRRRRLPNMYIQPQNYPDWVRRRLEGMLEEAKRQAGNHKVQGGAQGIMKRGMQAVQRYVIVPLQKAGISVMPLLQVHDELILEVEDDWADVVKLQVKQCMELDSSWFRIPIVAEAGVGQSWGEAK